MKYFSKSIKEYIIKEFQYLTELSNKDRNKILIEKVKKKFDYTLDKQDIYDTCLSNAKLNKKEVKQLKEKFEELNDSIEEKPAYRV